MSLAIVRGPVPSTCRHVDVCQVVRELRHSNPRMPEDRLAELLAERVEEDHHLLVDACRVVVRQTPIRDAERSQQRQSRKAPAAQRATRQEAEKAAVRQVAEKVRTVVLLDLLMPNGTAMRYCSGTQMAGFGKAYEKIAERAGEALVGEVLLEKDVRELLRAAG